MYVRSTAIRPKKTLKFNKQCKGTIVTEKTAKIILGLNPYDTDQGSPSFVICLLDTAGVYFITMGACSHLSPEILSLHVHW